MTREDYLKTSQGLSKLVSLVADKASEIIRKITQENANGGNYLWINNDDDELWIQEDKSRVVYIYADNRNTFVGVIEEDCQYCEDDTREAFLGDLNPWDRIMIADYLAGRF